MSVTQASPSAAVDAAPERISRHRLVDRLYHWAMAACVLTLLATAFLPIIGIKFDWLGLHWMTGVALAVLVIYHIVRASIWQSLRSMMIDTADIANGWRRLAAVRSRRGSARQTRQVQRAAEALSRRRRGPGVGDRRQRPPDATQDRHGRSGAAIPIGSPITPGA